MKLPNTAHTSRPWRIHELTRDFRPRTCERWRRQGGPDDFSRLVQEIASGTGRTTPVGRELIQRVDTIAQELRSSIVSLMCHCPWPPRPSGAASCLVHACMDGEDVDQPGQGKQPQHLLLRGREQQVTPGLPGMLAHSDQRC